MAKTAPGEASIRRLPGLALPNMTETLQENPQAVGDLVCEVNSHGIASCEVGRGDTVIEGLDEGACVSMRTRTWHAPGQPLHGTPADIRGFNKDKSGQAWAYVGPNKVVVPACVGALPNPTEQATIASLSVAGELEVDESPEENPDNAVHRPHSPACWNDRTGRLVAPGHWFHERHGRVVERFVFPEGDFKDEVGVYVVVDDQVISATICPDNPKANPSRPCNSNRDCPDGHTCVSGKCCDSSDPEKCVRALVESGLTAAHARQIVHRYLSGQMRQVNPSPLHRLRRKRRTALDNKLLKLRRLKGFR